LALTQRFLHKVDVVQRRMLWSVGWVRMPVAPWEITMQRKIKEWSTLRLYTHCRRGAINIL